MELKEVTTMLEMIRMAYPRYAINFDRDERKEQIGLYMMQFKDDDSQIVFKVLNDYIRYNEFPPSIADIRKGIDKLTQPSKQDLWDELVEAGKLSIKTMYTYEHPGDSMAKEVPMKRKAYESLSEPLKRYVGSANGLVQFNDERISNALWAKDRFDKRISQILADCKDDRVRDEIVGKDSKKIASIAKSMVANLNDGSDTNGNV